MLLYQCTRLVLPAVPAFFITTQHPSYCTRLIQRGGVPQIQLSTIQ